MKMINFSWRNTLDGRVKEVARMQVSRKETASNVSVRETQKEDGILRLHSLARENTVM